MLRSHLVHGGLPPPELTAPAQVRPQPRAQIAHLGLVRGEIGEKFEEKFEEKFFLSERFLGQD